MKPITLLTQSLPPEGGSGINRYTKEVSYRLIEDLGEPGSAGVRVVDIPMHGPKGPLWMRRHARLFFSKYLHRPEGRIISLCLWLIPPGTEIATIWDMIQKPNAFVLADRMIHWDLWRSVRTYPKDWVVLSEAVRRQAIKRLNLPSQRVHVAYPGVDPATFHPMFEWHDRPMRPPITILHVGIAYPRKRIDMIIEALAMLGPERFRFFRLGPASDRGYLALCVELAKMLGVEMISSSHIPDAELVRAYNRADLMVYPSSDEGAGIPPLEAMACGTNVVVSDIPPHREICGSFAHYARPGDPEDLARAIEAALAHPFEPERLIRHAHCFSWDATASVYRRILDGSA